MIKDSSSSAKIALEAANKAATVAAEAVRVAQDVVNKATETAAKLITPNSQDHDLLISLNVEVKGIREDIRELKDSTHSKMIDFEIRIRALERRYWYLAGGLMLLAFITPYVWSLLHK